MNELDVVSNSIFSEFGKSGQNVSVHAEGDVLVVKVGRGDTRILFWKNLPVENILETVRSCTIRENYKGDVLLHG